jgi:L-asparaginase
MEPSGTAAGHYGDPVTTARVVLFTLGGTISMSGSAGGVVARLGGAELMSGLDGFGDDVQVEVRDLRTVPSADLTSGDVLDAVEAAEGAVAGGASGVVLTQGTDTLEESSFLIDAVWRHDVPFVVTGAMRNPTLPGADGTANLLAAVRVAASSSARARGVLVVFDDEIHRAAHVRKTHSTSTATFAAPDTGPVGHVVERRARFLTPPTRTQPVRGWSRESVRDTRIGLYTAVFDDDGPVLAGAQDRYDGLVVAGFGVGHVPGALAPVLGDLAAQMPVVLTSRTGAGPVLAHTYGAVGSERDLLARGLIGGGFLHPYKARVLLRLLVAGAARREEIVTALARFGGEG